MERLAAALSDEHEVHAVFFEHGPMVDRLRSAGASVVIVDVADGVVNARRHGRLPGRDALGAVRRVRAELAAIGPDIVHTHSLKAGLVAGTAARTLRVPFVWHVHDRVSTDYLPRMTVAALKAALLLLPDAVAGNSRSTLATFRSRGPRAVVPNPVPGPPPGFRARDGRDGAPETFGLVGRITPWKGQDVFLEAFAQAFPRGPQRAVLVGAPMFGEESFLLELEALVTSLGLDGRVEFRGHRDDIWQELARLDVLVHASRIPEPFGLVIVEGLAAGLGVVAVDQGGPAEYLRGVRGVALIDRADRASLSAGLCAAASDGPSAEEAASVAQGFKPSRASESALRLYRAAAE